MPSSLFSLFFARCHWDDLFSAFHPVSSVRLSVQLGKGLVGLDDSGVDLSLSESPSVATLLPRYVNSFICVTVVYGDWVI